MKHQQHSLINRTNPLEISHQFYLIQLSFGTTRLNWPYHIRIINENRVHIQRLSTSTSLTKTYTRMCVISLRITKILPYKEFMLDKFCG